MKKFFVKFSILVGALWGLMGYYFWVVCPNIAGDIGYIGKIPFGHEYDERLETIYQNRVIRIHSIEEDGEIVDSVVTIGDSFSQLTEYDYNYFLTDALDCKITNICKTPATPEQTFVRLVNNGKICPGSIVIIESVERALIERLVRLNFEDSTIETSMQKQNCEITNNTFDDFIGWLRIQVGIKKPYKKFHTDRDLFSHSIVHNELYIYDSKWDDDGDLRFVDRLNDEDIKTAWENLYKFHQLAEDNDIKMIYLIAADKYDVYEAFICGVHVINPTLDKCPIEPWIINTKPILQQWSLDGMKDIYRINNTHWSPVCAERVAEVVSLRIRDVYDVGK